MIIFSNASQIFSWMADAFVASKNFVINNLRRIGRSVVGVKSSWKVPDLRRQERSTSANCVGKKIVRVCQQTAGQDKSTQTDAVSNAAGDRRGSKHVGFKSTAEEEWAETLLQYDEMCWRDIPCEHPGLEKDRIVEKYLGTL